MADLLSRDFYRQNACVVARDLLGARLVRQVDGARMVGVIVETEAYTGLDDQASHSSRGRTPRNAPMWENAGFAYVYLCYGMYCLLNVTCEPEGQPAAVLIRALEPREGLEHMAERRSSLLQKNWTNGPGRLTRALGVDLTHNRADLTTSNAGLWIEGGEKLPDEAVITGARVGLGKGVGEPWLSIHRRFWVRDNPYISR